MRYWNVKVSVGNLEVDFDLIDIRDAVGSIVSLNERVFNKLIQLALTKPNYAITFSLSQIKAPENVSFYPEQYMFLLATDKYDFKYGFLLITFSDMLLLAGVWPEGFAEALSKDREYLESIIYALAEKHNFWKEVIIIMHNNLNDVFETEIGEAR